MQNTRQGARTSRCTCAALCTAQENLKGTLLVTYDHLYRRQAAASHSLSWATKDQALYNEAFSGRAKLTVRCKQCLSEHHSVDTCPDIPRGWTLPNENHSMQPEVCRRYNQDRCHSLNCRQLLLGGSPSV